MANPIPAKKGLGGMHERVYTIFRTAPRRPFSLRELCSSLPDVCDRSIRWSLYYLVRMGFIEASPLVIMQGTRPNRYRLAVDRSGAGDVGKQQFPT